MLQRLLLLLGCTVCACCAFELRSVVINNLDVLLEGSTDVELSETAQHALLSARMHHFKYLILQDLEVISSTAHQLQLTSFMKQAMAVGIELIAGGKSIQDFDSRTQFCQKYFTGQPCFSSYLMDLPFWDIDSVEAGSDVCIRYLEPADEPCTINGAFAYWQSQMKLIRGNAPAHIPVNSYVGWPEAVTIPMDLNDIYFEIVAAVSNSIYLEAHVMTADTTFPYTSERLTHLQQAVRASSSSSRVKKNLGISFVFSVEEDFMQQYMLELPKVDKLNVAEDAVLNYPDTAKFFAKAGGSLHLLPFTYFNFDAIKEIFSE